MKNFYGWMDLPADGISNIVGHASSSRTTGGWIARIRFFNTTLTFTNVTRLTIRVSNTFRPTTSDGIGLGNQSWVASAKIYDEGPF